MLICDSTSQLEPVNTTQEEQTEDAPYFITQGRQNTQPIP